MYRKIPKKHAGWMGFGVPSYEIYMGAMQHNTRNERYEKGSSIVSHLHPPMNGRIPLALDGLSSPFPSVGKKKGICRWHD
jgi:hypothetical protein